MEFGGGKDPVEENPLGRRRGHRGIGFVLGGVVLAAEGVRKLEPEASRGGKELQEGVGGVEGYKDSA